MTRREMMLALAVGTNRPPAATQLFDMREVISTVYEMADDHKVRDRCLRAAHEVKSRRTSVTARFP